MANISELPFLPQVIKALSRPKEISPLPPPGGGADGGKSAQNQNMKAIRMLLTLMFLFCVCTAAPLVFNIYIMWGPGYFESVNIVGKCACVCVYVCVCVCALLEYCRQCCVSGAHHCPKIINKQEGISVEDQPPAC